MREADGLRIEGVLRVTETKLDRVLSPVELLAAINGGAARPLFRKNTVVDVGVDALVALLAGGWGNPTVGGQPINPANVDGLAVEQMRITDQVAPVAPSGADVALEGAPVWTFSVFFGMEDAQMTPTYPASGQVRFSGLVPQASLVGVTLTEEGLFSSSGLLIARTTFEYDKTGDFGLQFDHTLTIARA
jgi:hypothetical protein